MKNNVLVIVLVVIIGILSGGGLLFGISNAVLVAMSPVTARIGEITATQKDIQQKLNVPQGADVASRLAAIDQRLSAIEKKLSSVGGQQPQMPQPPQEDYTKVHNISIGESPVLGPANAPVTIVEFTDLQCPFCARFNVVIKEVLKAYPAQVNFVIKNYPLAFHPNARPAAKLALAANSQGKYFAVVDLLLENGAAVTEDKIKEYAQKAGLNYNKLMDEYKNKDAEWEKRVASEMALGEQVDVRGTPTFYINGRKTMARDLAGYKVEIDKILAEKK